jgi:small subunit ribosomal protein S5
MADKEPVEVVEVKEEIEHSEPVVKTEEVSEAAQGVFEDTQAAAEGSAAAGRFESSSRYERSDRPRRGSGDRSRGRRRDGDSEHQKDFIEKLIKLNRTAKVVKGGRRFSFSALTVVGDSKGLVGFGFGKANDVTEAIRKSFEKARRNLIRVPLKNGTIPHEIIGKYKGAQVLLKPACSGTGIIAGGSVRAIMEAAGATDMLSKSIGSRSAVNVVRATFKAVDQLLDGLTISKSRGKSLKNLWG